MKMMLKEARRANLKRRNSLRKRKRKIPRPKKK